MIAEKVFLGLQIFFIVMTFIGFVLLLMQVIDDAGISVVSMVWALVFGGIYRDIKHKNKS